MYSPLYFIKLHNTRTHAHTHGMRFIISRPAGRREIINLLVIIFRHRVLQQVLKEKREIITFKGVEATHYAVGILTGPL